MRSWLLILLGLAATAAVWFLLPVQDWLQAFGAWAASLGPLGPVAFAALFVLATLLVIPGTPLTIAGALAFGWWSLPIVLGAATVGSVLAFLAARFVLRRRVERVIARRPTMVATMEAVGDGGWQLLTLMRVSPFVPFNVQNYILGLTRVRVRDFFVSTLLGMIPGTILCVYLGVIGRTAADSAAHWIPLGLGLVATFGAVAVTRRRVQAKLAARGLHPASRSPRAADPGAPAPPRSEARWLRPGQTCWRIEQADRLAVLHDGAAYFAAARSAMLEARHSILLIGWSFDPRLRLAPDGSHAPEGETLVDLLHRLRACRPDLAIHILIWDMPWPLSAGRDLTPEAVRALLGPGIGYRVDATLPFGACQHQKILVVDDAVAFCGGGDFEANRWDTPAHRDGDPRRRLPSGETYPPRHDIMMAVDGPAAAALGDLARQRWHEATGERLPPPPARDGTPWPASVTPLLHATSVALSRTRPAGPKRAALHENAALYATAIRGAAHVIYLENQYLTSPLIGAALMARLGEAEGPEIIIVVAERSPNAFDRLTMDSARRGLIRKLRAADRFDRLRILAPHTAEGRPILVHSKVGIFDDRLVRIGSTNLNNRSLGYDSECDLAIEVLPSEDAPLARSAILRLRDGLLAHHAGCPREDFEEAVRRRGSLRAVLDDPSLVAPRRLCPLVPSRRGALARLVEAWHLGDPASVRDAWRPWRRAAALEQFRRGERPAEAPAAQTSGATARAS